MPRTPEIDSVHTSSRDRTPETWDLVGIGFGPSNLALAATIEEEGASVHGRDLKHVFFERKESFAWHPGMMLPGARIQLNFLKDLATLRNPQSRFTFLRYLYDRSRLDKFVNLRSFFPTRAEFNDYYTWAADQLEDRVRYGHSVRSITPVAADGGVDLLRLVVEPAGGGETRRILARNLVLATGGSPYRPPGLRDAASPRILHYEDFLSSVRELFPDRDGEHRFVVVGSGQTAAEIFHYLLTHYESSEITATMRRYAYKPADESHFVNEIFFPDMVDFVYDLDAETRDRLFDTHADTNYSAVDREVIEAIYTILYEREVAGDERAAVRPFLEMVSARDTGDAVQVHFRDLVHDRPEVVEADAVILATGVSRPVRHPLLEEMADHLILDEYGGFRVSRSYRLETRGEFRPRIYLQGYCERTHGLSDTLLSVLPMRAMEILEDMAGSTVWSQERRPEDVALPSGVV